MNGELPVRSVLGIAKDDESHVSGAGGRAYRSSSLQNVPPVSRLSSERDLQATMTSARHQWSSFLRRPRAPRDTSKKAAHVQTEWIAQKVRFGDLYRG